MPGPRRTSDTRKATDSLGKLNIAKRSVQIISSGATSTARAAEKTAGAAKSAAAATRRTATAGAALRAEGDSSEQAAERANDVFARASQHAAEGTARGTAKVVRGGAKLTGKAVKGGIVAAQKRVAAAKAAQATKATAESAVTVSRAGAAVARAGAAAFAAVKGMVAAVAAAVSSTPVIAILIGVLAAILAVLSVLSWLPGMTSANDPEYGHGGEYPVGVPPGPWGGHENGRIPEEFLAPIPWSPDYLLREDATASLSALNEDYTIEFGHALDISAAYRDYAGQVEMRDYWCARGKCGNAALPGTSNHGWALAVDLGGGIASFGTAEYEWMKSNASKYGWQHPSWAEPDGSAPEPWHWDFWGWAGDGDVVPEGEAQAYAQLKLMELFGLSDQTAQFKCLKVLWTNESGWSHTAENPSSGAYGIPQALPGSKMASAGADWRTNPKTQIDWGLQYIKDSYGTPCEAWDFWQSNNPHWY